jgi:class 3 adenylate cyclase
MATPLRHLVGRTVRLPTRSQAEQPTIEPLAPAGLPAALPPAGFDRHRVLAAILSLDVVGSTERAAKLGDDLWLDQLAAYHAVARRQVAMHRGQLLSALGDGVWAAFAMPVEAIECAMAMVESLTLLAIPLRAGVHAGECQWLDGSADGLVMHICARVVAEAGPGEILVTGTVKDLVAGTPLAFKDRDHHELRGVPGSWQLFMVTGYRAASRLWTA